MITTVGLGFPMLDRGRFAPADQDAASFVEGDAQATDSLLHNAHRPCHRPSANMTAGFLDDQELQQIETEDAANSFFNNLKENNMDLSVSKPSAVVWGLSEDQAIEIVREAFRLEPDEFNVDSKITDLPDIRGDQDLFKGAIVHLSDTMLQYGLTMPIEYIHGLIESARLEDFTFTDLFDLIVDRNYISSVDRQILKSEPRANESTLDSFDELTWQQRLAVMICEAKSNPKLYPSIKLGASFKELGFSDEELASLLTNIEKKFFGTSPDDQPIVTAALNEYLADQIPPPADRLDASVEDLMHTMLHVKVALFGMLYAVLFDG